MSFHTIVDRLHTSLVPIMALLILTLQPVTSYSSGAPSSRCSSMTPGHGSQPGSSAPYTITTSANNYLAGDAITVTISGTFQGLILQMRQVGSTSRYGTWSNLPANTRTMTCSNSGDTVTQSSSATKTDVTLTWTAPDDVTVDLQVVATILQGYSTWWKGVTSSTLTYGSSTTTTPSGSNIEAGATPLSTSGAVVATSGSATPTLGDGTTTTQSTQFNSTLTSTTQFNSGISHTSDALKKVPWISSLFISAIIFTARSLL